MIECHCGKCEKLVEEKEKLREALTDVMTWIENWRPRFTEDETWPEDRDKAYKALKDTE